MNLDPNKFERTILELERKRFGIDEVYNQYPDKAKRAHHSKYGRGPAKRATLKSTIQSEEPFALSRVNLSPHRESIIDIMEQESARSSNRSFDRYKTNLCYKKKVGRKGEKLLDEADHYYHTSSTPQLTSIKKRRHMFKDSELLKSSEEYE